MPTLQVCRPCESTFSAQFHAARFCTSTLEGIHIARSCETDIIGELNVARACDSQLWTQPFVDYWVGTQAATATWAASGSDQKLVVPNPIPTLLLNGSIDLSDLVQDLTIDESWNGVSQLTFSLRPPDTNGIVSLPSELVPPGFGAFSGLIKRHGFTLGSTLQVKATIAGETWHSPTYLPTDPELDESGLLRWGGEDLTGLLLQEHQQMDSIQLEAGQNVKAHATIRAIAARYGIQNVVCNFPDFLIRELHRSGETPLSWIEKLTHAMQAAKHWIGGDGGDTLVFESFRPADPVSWEFVDALNIWKLHGPAQLPRPKNRFTYSRIEPAGNILAEAELTGPECLTRQTIPLNKPSRFVQVEMRKMINGEPKDWVFWDVTDSPVAAVGEGIAVSAIPIKSFAFNYVYNVTTGKWTPHYELIARGNGVLPSHNQNFSKTWPPLSTPSITQLYDGINPEWTIQESAVIADPDTAMLAAKAAEGESVRKFWAITLGTPYLNPFVRPGQRIRVTDYLTRQSGITWFIEHLQKKWNRSQGTWEMRMECNRGV